MLWTIAITSARAARLPNDFSKEHWFIDYRFGFVKRGLMGTIVSLATRLAHARETERLIDIVASAQFVLFCFVLMVLGLHIIRRSGWSPTATLAVLVFLSSPFMVMSAHLIGYYDNIIIVLTVLSLALLFQGWIWSAVILQAVSVLVHENALLVGFPVFCWSWWLVTRQTHRWRDVPAPFWPLLVPIVAFAILVASQSMAPRGLEQSLATELSRYPFIARNIDQVRVPHWITITFYDSYVLHQGQFLGRLLSQPMIGLVLPSMLAILGVVFEAGRVGALSAESMILSTVCLAPQMMHVMAWDTARIWTYSILCAFLLLWAYIEVFRARAGGSQFVRFLGIIALILNAIDVTPLMDGEKDHFDITMRVLLYAPVLAVALGLAWVDRRGGDSTAPRSAV
jgi:hypothetical protein